MYNQVMIFHVSNTGDDENSGSENKPFRSIPKARDALRERLAADSGITCATVFIHAGIYALDETLDLDASDSNFGKCTVTYSSCDGQVRIIGGKILTGIEPLSNMHISERLAPEVRGRIMQCDLRANGISDSGRIVSRGHARDYAPSHLELFFNGSPMNLAQYPDPGRFLEISGAPTGRLEDGFYYDSDRPKLWKDDSDIWVRGYWGYDHANTNERIDRFDKEEKHISTHPDYGLYFFGKGNRFYFFNVLEELDTPGEFYVDRESGFVYLYPVSETADSEIIASVLESPVIALKNASGISFEGLTVEGGRGHGFEISDCEGISIKECIIRNLGMCGVRIDRGRRYSITGCDIFNTGDGCVRVDAGDRHTLESGETVISNNDFHHFARLSRCYRSGVNDFGVGTRVTNNIFHDCPHSAIFFRSNDLFVGHNEFYNVCTETGDCGAVYGDSDYSIAGVEITGNYFHHMAGYGDGSVSVYADACLSFVRIIGNYFFETTQTVYSNGGYRNSIVNNVFVRCDPIGYISAEGMHPGQGVREQMDGIRKEWFYDKKPNMPPYSVRYPEMLEVYGYFEKTKDVTAMVPALVFFENNVICGPTTRMNRHWTVTDDMVVENGNYTADEDEFEDIEFSDIRLRSDSAAFGSGYMRADSEAAGLLPDEMRASAPVKVNMSLSAISKDECGAELMISAKNRGNTAIGFDAVIYDRFNAPWPAANPARICFIVQPGEIESIMVRVPLESDKMLEVRSDTSGIRPGRLIL